MLLRWMFYLADYCIHIINIKFILQKFKMDGADGDKGHQVCNQRLSKIIAEVRLAQFSVAKVSKSDDRKICHTMHKGNNAKGKDLAPSEIPRSPSNVSKEMAQTKVSATLTKTSTPKNAASWLGSCISNENGRKFYGSFSKDGHRFKVNDCVQLKTRRRDSTDVWLMKIINFWEEEDFQRKNKSDVNMFFRGVWLYRQADLPRGLNIAQHRQEIFLSDWEDENSLDCIQNRCKVLFRNAQPETNEELNGFDFVCWRSYAVSNGRVAVCNFPDPLSLPSNASTSGCSLQRKTLPVDLREIGIASWNGPCTAVENGRRYFCGFSKNGHSFEINDCVYVRSAEKDKIWIMKILKLWEEESWFPRDKNDQNMFFRGVWLYRPSDTPQGISIAIHSREIFLSDWEDENSLECVQTKCSVFFRSSAPDVKEEINGAHFVCWRKYAVSTGRISACKVDGDDSGDGCRDACKAGLQEELRMGRLITMRVNARDGEEARRLLRQTGHMLVEAMVHMPVTHISRLLLSPVTETLLLLHVSYSFCD
jgi:hypothetical protein